MSQARFAEQALGLDRLENVGRLWAGGMVQLSGGCPLGWFGAGERLAWGECLVREVVGVDSGLVGCIWRLCSQGTLCPLL